MVTISTPASPPVVALAAASTGARRYLHAPEATPNRPVQVCSRRGGRPDPAALGPWTGFGLFSLYIAVLLGVAVWRLCRRDV
jgi:hypothetical protein